MYASVPGSGSPPRPPTSTATAAVRPFIAFAVLALALYSLLAHWEQRGSASPMFSDPENPDAQTVFEIDVGPAHPSAAPKPDLGLDEGNSTTEAEEVYDPQNYPRKVVAHFMLGNTYPFTEYDWVHTLIMAEAVGLDGLVLNLGPENWQLRQAKIAYNLATKRIYEHRRERPLQLFLSLDMNVLPSQTLEDAYRLADNIAPLLSSPAQMTRKGRPILSTFSGERAFGPQGWQKFLAHLNDKIASTSVMRKVFFWPTFFMDTHRFIGNKDADGLFAWNSAWPMSNNKISIESDLPYLQSGKPFMAAVSPLFFTHYGKEGNWAYNKNWLYRSDDLLYPNRWSQILALKPSEAPEMIQVLSWNDYGESHNIAPVIGHEPGSTEWTRNMDHIAFREMTSYFLKRWRDNAPEVREDKIIIWMWYRPHPKKFYIENDPVGRPHNVDWAQDLINIMVLVPKGLPNPMIQVQNGASAPRTFKLFDGHANGLKVSFLPGDVTFRLWSDNGVHVNGKGRPISNHRQTKAYNFNMWSRAWHIPRDHVVTAPHHELPPPATKVMHSPTLAYHPVTEVSTAPAYETSEASASASEHDATGPPVDPYHRPAHDTPATDLHPGNGEHDPSPMADYGETASRADSADLGARLDELQLEEREPEPEE